MTCDLALILIVAAIGWMFSIVLAIKVYDKNNRLQPMSIDDHRRAIRKIEGKEDFILDGGILLDSFEYGVWSGREIEGIERAEVFVELFRGPGNLLRGADAIVYVSRGGESGMDAYVLQPREIYRDLREETIEFNFKSDVFHDCTIESFKVVHGGRVLTSRVLDIKMKDGDTLNLTGTLRAKG